jgi:hypothetical protein
MDFASPQDWMREPVMIERTGLSVREHQARTVANYLDLRMLAPRLPFIRTRYPFADRPERSMDRSAGCCWSGQDRPTLVAPQLWVEIWFASRR